MSPGRRVNQRPPASSAPPSRPTTIKRLEVSEGTILVTQGHPEGRICLYVAARGLDPVLAVNADELEALIDVLQVAVASERARALREG